MNRLSSTVSLLSVSLFLASSAAATGPSAPTEGSRDATSGSPADSHREAALAHFEAGRKYMAAGDYAKACDAFQESVRLQSHVGSHMNLALCLASEKNYASAHVEYLEAAELARKLGDSRASYALGEAAKLEPKVQRVRLEVEGADETTSVKLNGKMLRASDLTRGVPVDPGHYEILVEQRGRAPTLLEVQVEREKALDILTVPALAPLVNKKEPSSEQATPAPPQESSATDSKSPLPWIALGTAGLGTVTGIVGGVLYGTGKKKADDADCRPESYVCTADGEAQRDSGASQANAGIGLMVAGGALLVGGLTTYLITGDVLNGDTAFTTRPQFSVAPVGSGGFFTSIRGRF